ncbi:hypothetical protein H6776_02095 [Candidatus Nomurabacteria bacterium]|nr:hypothetical protein [Candidatus Nomurabacteria bacterium]
MKNLAENIIRQRLVVEGLTNLRLDQEILFRYLKELTQLVAMKPLRDPEVSPAGDIGIGAWQHWMTSGCHVYSYDKKYTGKDYALITVDTYTCKPFDPQKVVEFTKDFFQAEEIAWKEV